MSEYTGVGTQASLRTVSSIYAKVFIGFVAGLAIAIAPRVSAYWMDPDGFDYFTESHLWMVSLLALLLGVLVAIFEYGVPKPPKDTFFNALAIPGLIMGALNGAINADNNQDPMKKALENGIAFEKIEVATDVEPQAKTGVFMSLIPSAQAQELEPDRETAQSAGDSSLLKQFAPRPLTNFHIELDQLSTRDSANQELSSYRQEFPDAAIITDTSGNHRIVTDLKGKSRNEAVMEALTIQRKTNVAPRIIQTN